MTILGFLFVNGWIFQVGLACISPMFPTQPPVKTPATLPVTTPETPPATTPVTTPATMPVNTNGESYLFKISVSEKRFQQKRENNRNINWAKIQLNSCLKLKTKYC